jgi:hypothetical protein
MSRGGGSFRGGPGGGGGPFRGGPGGRGRGNFGIWQEGVGAVHDLRLQHEEDKVVSRFKAAADNSPEYPLRKFLEFDATSHIHHFVLKVLDGGHSASPA